MRRTARPRTHSVRPDEEPRRHELDALRAFAMLLGVVLHAALTFFPEAWPVQDRTAGFHGPWEELVIAVHGFRMPVFFLLSGFFTAMLWRCRGLPALIRHRLRRVALPLALAMVTVGPAMDWVVDRALRSGAKGYSVHELAPRLEEFHHLWFLWMLLWLLAGFLVVAFVADRVRPEPPRGDRGAQPAWLRWVMWLLIPLTLLPQLGMAKGGAYPMFGPDTDTGLLPPLHRLAYYAAFFSFGALAYGRRDRNGALLADTLGRRWPVVLPVSVLVVFPVGLAVTYLPEVRSWAVSQVLQVLYAWGMCLGLIGAVSDPPDPRAAERALPGGCLVLDLPRSPAAGDRRADRPPRLGPAVRDQVPADHRRGDGGPAAHLSGIRPPHADRHPAEWPKTAIGCRTGSGRVRMIKPKRLRPGSRIAAVSLSWGGPGAFPHVYAAGKRQFEGEFEVTVTEAAHACAIPSGLLAIPRRGRRISWPHSPIRRSTASSPRSVATTRSGSCLISILM